MVYLPYLLPYPFIGLVGFVGGKVTGWTTTGVAQVVVCGKVTGAMVGGGVGGCVATVTG